MAETINDKKMTLFLSGQAERIKGVLISLRKILTFSPADDLILPKSNISASIESGGLSVAYCSRSFSRIYLKGVRKYPFQGDRYPQPKDVTSSLAFSAKEFGVSNPEITLGIPKAWTIIRTVEFPSTIRENIVGVVSGEMDRLTPFSADEVLFDFRVLRDDGERLTVMVMAVRAAAVMPYIDDLNENGYTVSRITASLTGLGSLCWYLYKNADNIVVEVDDKEYVGSLFIDGFLTRTRAGELEGDDESRFDAVSECVRSLSDAAGREGISPEVVAIFSNNSDPLKGLLESRIETPARIMDDADTRLGFSGNDGELPFAAAGCAVQSLWPDAKGPNLLKKGMMEKDKSPLVLTIILVLAIVFTWVFHLTVPVEVEKVRLEKISLQIGLKREEVMKVEAIKSEIDVISSEITAIERFKEEMPMRIDILRELTTVIPDDAWLTKTRISAAKVEIEGLAGSAIELLPKLDMSEYFSKVEFTSPTIRDAKIDSDRFKIKMEIESVEKGAAEESDDAKE